MSISKFPPLRPVAPSSQVIQSPGKFRFHVPALPHTVSNETYITCAHTQKIRNFCQFMSAAGHIVIHYGHPLSQVNATEHVSVITEELFDSVYPKETWHTTMFTSLAFTAVHGPFNQRTILEIQRRKQKNDFLLVYGASSHIEIAKALPDLIIVEPGIGYSDTVDTTICPYKVFESYAIMNEIYSHLKMRPSFYDVVIPNSFVLDEFPFSAEANTSLPYFAYVGRVVHNKGVGIAIDATRALGIRLVIAGPGRVSDFYKGNGSLEHVEEVGIVNSTQRQQLLAGASGLFVCSLYTEPFGRIGVEGLLCGTPLITTDWGAMAEYNLHGITGYRCRTMQQFVTATRAIAEGKIQRRVCRQWAEQNYSVERIREMYEAYFERLFNLRTGKDWTYVAPLRDDSEERRQTSYCAVYYPDAICKTK